LLAPLLMLLLVAGVSLDRARRAHGWRQVEARFRGVAQTLSEATFLRTHPPPDEGLSGADFLLVSPSGKRTATFPAAELELPSDTVADDWPSLRLSARVTVGGKAYLCSGLRLHRHPENAGDILYILYPESLWRDALWEAVRPPLLLGGFVGLASVALAVFLGQGLSRRVRELERRTRLIAAGDFSPMPLPGTNDELRDLACSVNEMAQQLSQLRGQCEKTERLRLLGQVSGGLAHQARRITGRSWRCSCICTRANGGRGVAAGSGCGS
jgi:HAMP domain-containing protein